MIIKFSKYNIMDSTILLYCTLPFWSTVFSLISKKTLFEINNDYRKNFTVDTDIIMDTLNRTVRVYKHLIEDIITNCVIEDKTMLFIKIDHKLNKLSQNMINLFINSNEESNKYIRIIEFIEKKLEHKEVDRILILEILTKKMRKKDIGFKQIFNKINNKNNNCNLEDMSPQRYVNWLLI